MNAEQPDLFADISQESDSQDDKLQETEEQNVKQSIKEKMINEEACLPFLPGLKMEQVWLDIKDLAELRTKGSICTLCRLRSTCNQVVFGEGPDGSRLMLIGEGPGREEDIKGHPFVGRAGQLLDKILLAAEIKRDEVYITNVVKCRPPQNRLPDAEEVKACKGYLEAQIRLIKPDIIICLGALASQVVIDPRARITQIRGKWFVREGKKIMAVYHPAALLRNAEYKRPTWEDFKLIRDEYKSLRK